MLILGRRATKEKMKSDSRENSNNRKRSKPNENDSKTRYVTHIALSIFQQYLFSILSTYTLQ